jgi:hypothetical protein
VVDFLSPRHVPVGAKLRHHGQTGLHWAAYGGHADTVELLLHRGAPVEIKDDSFDGTPLGWALYAWGTGGERRTAARRYDEVVALLMRAGAEIDEAWYAEDEDRRRALKKARSDPRMRAALGGKLPSQ